ncbi:MAG: polysaccharide deacetylase family protein [Eubacteriales bacterium]
MRKTYKYLLTLILITSAISVSLFGQCDTEAAEDKLYLPIIMYHEVKHAKSGKDAITPYEFESDLKYLKDNGYTPVTMTALINYVRDGLPLPDKPIVISFDDGYLNTYKFAYPLIKKYGMSMVLSLIGKSSDDFTQSPSKSIDFTHVTWDQLNEMLSSGLVEVQNHTYNLHKMNGPHSGRLGCIRKYGESDEEYERILREDITKLQRKLLITTGYLPNTFTYPYGKYNSISDRIIRELGFKASLSCDFGINIITRDPECLYNLKRVGRPHGTSLERVLKKAWDNMRWVK